MKKVQREKKHAAHHVTQPQTRQSGLRREYKSHPERNGALNRSKRVKMMQQIALLKNKRKKEKESSLAAPLLQKLV